MESLRGIVNFTRTAELGSFAKAGRDLGISAVAVSQNISRLEKRLGVRLLARSTRQLSLTAEGETFLAQCRLPLAELELACRQVADDAGAPSGRVRVTAVSPVAYLYLVPALPAFFARHPGIDLDLELSEDANPLIGRRFDVGIRVGALLDESFVARPLGPLRLLMCASVAYLSHHGAPASLDELAQHRLLVAHFADRPHPTPFLVQDRADANGPVHGPVLPRMLPTQGTLAGHLVCNDYRSLLAACEAGLGIAQIPQPMALDALRGGRLKVLLPEHTLQGLQLFIHYASRRQLPARVRAFVDFAVELLGGHPDLSVDTTPWAVAQTAPA
jgi:DNA-binding transcriptional LysR family regulator